MDCKKKILINVCFYVSQNTHFVRYRHSPKIRIKKLMKFLLYFYCTFYFLLRKVSKPKTYLLYFVFESIKLRKNICFVHLSYLYLTNFFFGWLSVFLISEVLEFGVGLMKEAFKNSEKLYYYFYLYCIINWHQISQLIKNLIRVIVLLMDIRNISIH